MRALLLLLTSFACACAARPGGPDTGSGSAPVPKHAIEKAADTKVPDAGPADASNATH